MVFSVLSFSSRKRQSLSDRLVLCVFNSRRSPRNRNIPKVKLWRLRAFHQTPGFFECSLSTESIPRKSINDANRIITTHIKVLSVALPESYGGFSQSRLLLKKKKSVFYYEKIT